MSSVRRRVLALSALTGFACALASSLPAGADQASVDGAKRQVQQAQANAAAEDSRLGAARAQLNEAQTNLARIQQQEAGLDSQIAAQQVAFDGLQALAMNDKAALANFLRQSYEGNLPRSLAYVLAADNFSAAIQREIAATTMADAGRLLVDRINAETEQMRQALDALNQRRAQLQATRQQAQTNAVLVAVEERKLVTASYAAHVALNASRADEVAAEAQFIAEQAALVAARAKRDLVFAPVAGVNFSIDTDLTRPSGVTAARLDTFLRGTAFEGLGSVYVAAEAAHHVSARYLLAHSIEESAFGTSAIAIAKHNIFGYGADDAHPFTDAVTFPSFAACIDAVAGDVASDYLSPQGRYYHGPTLRGMNISYATDPGWADNIATIADAIP